MAKNDTKSKASDEKDEDAKGAASGQNDDSKPADGVEGPGDPDIGASAILSDPEESAAVAKEYDQATQERLEAQENDTEELREGVVRRQGAVLVEPRSSRGDLGVGTNTTYPGSSTRFGTSNAGEAIRLSKGLAIDDIRSESNNSWTAQSAAGFLPSNATDVPGQTVTSSELPDPNSVANSNLPAFSIPAGLVVDPAAARPLVEDSLNGSQEGGDLGTAPKKNRTGAADQPATLSSISPTSGPLAGGTSVTATGSNFNPATGVTVGGTAATNFKVLSPTKLTFTTPAGGTVGAKPVVVQSPGGNSADAVSFTYA